MTPPSHVAANEAGRKKHWVQLIEMAARAIEAGADLSDVQQRARRIAEHVGELALQGYSLLSAEDRAEIIEAATARFLRASPAMLARVDNPERLFHHAIRCEVVALIERRIATLEGGDALITEDRLDIRALSWLAEARRRAGELRRLQRRVFRLTLALDSVGPVISDETTQERVHSFLIGVALGLRVNAVHQHQARIRKRLFEGDACLPEEGLSDALRYLWAPPFELACAALVYRAGYQTSASQRMYIAQKEYAQRLKSCKEASERARRAWRALVASLDASPQRPKDVHAELLRACEELGIDDRVSRGKSPPSTWADMLLDDDAKRPIGAERGAWRLFLHKHWSSPEVAERFRDFEARSVEADQERSAVAAAYQALLSAAHDLEDLVKTITDLLDLAFGERSVPGRG